MTKLKSKKMTKSTFAVIIMAVVMVAMLAFGGTYAYFTATATGKSDTAQTGSVLLKNNVVTLVDTNVVPGMELLKAETNVSVVNDSNVATFIFVKFSVKGATDTATLTAQVGSDWTDYHTIDESVAEGTVYFNEAAAVSTETTIVVTSSIKFDEKQDSVSLDGVENGNMSQTITVTLESASIQQEGLTVKTAYEELVKDNRFIAAA